MKTTFRIISCTLLMSCVGGCTPGKVFHGLLSEQAKDGLDSDGDGIPDGEEIDPGLPNTGGDDIPENAPRGTGPGGTAAIPPDAPGCGRGKVAPASRTPVHLMFVLDRSDSMNDDDEAEAANRDTKWVSLQKAMRAVFNDMGNAAANGATATALGVDYFSDGGATGKADTKIELGLSLLDRARANTLMSDVQGRKAEGYTPTQAALQISYGALKSYRPGGALANATKAAVLVSDGQPNPEPTLSIPDLVQDALDGDPSMRTFSVGIGELNTQGTEKGYDPKFMSQIAARGGTARAGCDPSSGDDPNKFCHFQVTPSQSANITADLVAAFATIRGALRSCELPLNIEKPDELEPRAVIVIAQKEGAEQRIIPKDPQNGWSFDSETAPTRVRLHGSECEVLKADPALDIFAILGCACKPVPTRVSEGEGEGDPTSPWNTNWCSYPWVEQPCVGEGCR